MDNCCQTKYQIPIVDPKTNETKILQCGQPLMNEILKIKNNIPKVNWFIKTLRKLHILKQTEQTNAIDIVAERNKHGAITFKVMRLK